MTQTVGHLLIEEHTLPPGQEWPVAGGSWRFVRVRHGAAYWMGAARTRSLAEGELMVISPQIEGSIRASQINQVVLQSFNFQPDLLGGLLTLAERHFFETAAAKKTSDAQFLPSTHPAVEQFCVIAAETQDQPELVQRTRLLGLVVSLIGKGLATHRASETSSVSARQRFQKLVSKMPDTEFINQTPETLAGLCGCIPRHFSRLFQDQFGTSARERQTQLRLEKARQLLADTNAKIIQIALDCGYRSVSLFNSMFKERYKMTPSAFRRRSAKKVRPLTRLAALLLPALLLIGNHLSAALTNAPLVLGTETPAADVSKARQALREKMSELNLNEDRKKLFPVARTNSVASTNVTKFEVKGYQLSGNTLLPTNTLDLILKPYTGAAVSIDDIRHALGDLQLAYRELGYVTVGVALPPQQLTNGFVKVQVTEGRLVAVNVMNNRHFSSNNIMRALPSLRTNILLNSHVLQRELDAANASRDRQISPVIAPGPEPGTSVLELRIKDRLPWHARAELNNDNTPNTPELRGSFNTTYDNLWDLGHKFGVQYGFSPGGLKLNDRNETTPFDAPLIANYSAYYRMPLGGVQAVQREIDASRFQFGYNEATRRFQLPPATGQAELSVYASRSTSDTGIQLGALQTVTTNNPLLKIFSQDSGEDLTLNESFGAKISVPLRNSDDNGVRAVASFGIDFKRYRLASFNTNNFLETITFTNSSGQFTTNYTVSSGQPGRYVAVDYLPLNAGLDISIPDRWGSTALSVALNANLLPALSGNADFARASYSQNARAHFVTLDYSVNREQAIYHDWAVSFHLNGQLANSALISNEQTPLGGQASVRGYREGSVYGDSGWHIQIEPHSPYFNLGMVDGTLPMLVRASAFFDYGQAYHHDAAFPGVATLMGAGCGLNATVGSHLDFRFQLAMALHDSPGQLVKAGDLRITFGLGAQF